MTTEEGDGGGKNHCRCIWVWWGAWGERKGGERQGGRKNVLVVEKKTSQNIWGKKRKVYTNERFIRTKKGERKWKSPTAGSY